MYSGDLFVIVVRPLTEEAVGAFSIKVRVTDPSFATTDSGSKYPSFVGQSIRLSYGFDFFESAPYPTGGYQVQLRVDSSSETSVTVYCP